MAATLTTPDTPTVSVVGQLLRGWRAARGMSPLDLAMHAGFSPRHVSFIETGRGPAVATRPSAPLVAADLLLPVHVRTAAFELRLFSTIMTLGTPQDVTLQELRIETFFPADAASETTWRQLTATSDPAS